MWNGDMDDPKTVSERQAAKPRWCLACGRPLQAVGWARRNGKATYGDRAARRYHARCFKLLGRVYGQHGLQ